MGFFERALGRHVGERVFRDLRLDEAWERTLPGLAQRGPLVFVARTLSSVDALALAHVVGRSGLPPVGFVRDKPWLPGVLGAPTGPHGAERDALAAALERGATSLISLEEPPGLLARKGRGRNEGEALLHELVSWGRRGREVTLVPVTVLFTLRPGHLGLSPLDAVFGPTEMPGDLRAAAQLLLSYRGGAVRMSDPIDVRGFTRAEASASDDTLVQRLTYALLRKVERERRAVLGPVQKSPERLRDEVLRSQKVRRIVDDLSGGDAQKRLELEQKARLELERLAAAPQPDLVRAIEPFADRLVGRVFAGIDVDPEGVASLREAARRGTVVLLPSHKSHVDYLVLMWVLRKQLLELPVVAAGDNLAFFPVGEVLRRGGAFFIRRQHKADRLYAAVIDAYVRRLLKDRHAIEFYLEGGRSRTGKQLAPMVGLLNLVVDAALGLEGRPAAFVPIAINYERVMEDFELSRERAGARKERESARSFFAIADALRYDYGRVAVTFGAPIDLDALRAELHLPPGGVTPAKRRALVHQLATRIVRSIHASSAVTGGGLVAMALLDMPGRGLSHPALVAECRRLLAAARRVGARPAASLMGTDGALRTDAVREAALVLVRGGLVRQHVPDEGLERPGEIRLPGATHDPPRDEVVYAVPEEARGRLDLVKNQILHFFAERSLIAVSFLAARTRRVARAALLDAAAGLARLLRHDLISLGDPDIEERLTSALQDLVDDGALVASAGEVSVGPGSAEVEGGTALASLAAHLVPMLESYRVAARVLRALRPGVPEVEGELTTRALRLGREMFLGGALDRREALSQPTVLAALAAFVQEGVITRTAAGLALAEGTDEPALRRLEARFAALLPRGVGGSEAAWFAPRAAPSRSAPTSDEDGTPELEG